jgi:hypothetical protein
MGYKQINETTSPALLLGATTYWLLWLCRNDVVFERKPNPSPLQVIYLVIHWLRSWIIVQKPALQDFYAVALRHLALVAKEFFTQAHGWWSSLLIDDS